MNRLCKSLLALFMTALLCPPAIVRAEDGVSFFETGDASESCAIGASLCDTPQASVHAHGHERFKTASRDRTIHKEITGNKLYITIFYTHDCPHCRDALAFLDGLQEIQSECRVCSADLGRLEEALQGGPKLVIRAYEVKRHPENMKLFRKFARAYNTSIQGVPTIFIGEKFYVGYRKGTSCTMIAEEIARQLRGDTDGSGAVIDVPFIGEVDVRGVSLLQFTAVLGFLDGFNPCAMWVLMFLLGLLVYSRSRRRILLVGTVFVAASGFVYFAFMAAWFNLFRVIGLSSLILKVLAAIAMGMGLINLKDVFFFKKGISLTIPESAKPSLYRRTRSIMHEQRTLFAVIGTVILAVFVNFIELACTVGLPAIFTKVLAEREVSAVSKYLYLIGYNIAYVVPLFVIVVLFAVTLGRFKMKESHGRLLKLISGLLMFGLGLILLLRPELLIVS